MAINLQEVQGFPANTVEFAVLVQNNGVTESIAKLYLHYRRCKILEFSCWIGSMAAKPVIPQHATRYTLKPSKLECFPAEYALMNRMRNGTSIGKLYTSLEDLLFMGFARAQLGQALHIRLM
jgi:hypothetical protein